VGLPRDQLVARLIRAGEVEISGENQIETDSEPPARPRKLRDL
jgi:hypothetical protein